MKKYRIVSIVALLFIMAGCADLDIENPNRGSLAEVYADPNEFLSVVEGQYLNLWHATQHWRSANSLLFATVADSHTSSWGNFGMRDLSSEPRIAIDNSQTYNYAYVIETAYEDNYAAIAAVNNVLRILDADPTLVVSNLDGEDITLRTRAEAHYVQGLAYGNLALTYDKGKFVDETVDLQDVSELPFDDYATLMTKALAKLDQAVTLANQAPDFIIAAYNGITLSRDEFVKLVRTMQAKFMIYVARTEAENSATDWSKVLSLANQGIEVDFAPVGDGSSWWDAYKYYGTQTGWARVDYRVINAMDPSQPSRFPTDGSHPLPPAVGDNRLVTDMNYEVSIPFRAERGLYHYSHYDYTRYDYHFPSASGAMPHTTVVENDLIKAEALMMTGDNATAATLINNTRVTRGGLPAAAAGDADLKNKLLHERYVELYSNMAGIPFYDRRRTADDTGSFGAYTGLQPGSFRQMPLSAKELNILNEEIYTFGGTEN